MQARGRIAVAGATGRVGHHVLDLLEAAGHDVVAMSRSNGVDVVSGDGLAEALTGVECIIDVASGSSPDQQAATEFFAAAARNLQEVGERAGVQRIVVVSIIGMRSVHCGLQRGEGRPRAGDAVGPDPGTDIARGAVPRVRRATCGVGQAGRGELRAEDAHAAGRRQDRRPGARRPGHRPGNGAGSGIRRGIDPWRSPVRGRKASSRWRDCSRPGAVTRCGSRA